jgi:hypothetical protein
MAAGAAVNGQLVQAETGTAPAGAGTAA